MDPQEILQALRAAHAEGDSRAAERLAALYESAIKSPAAPSAAAAAPAGAAGAATRGGSTATGRGLQEAIGIAATAPAKGVTGLMDLGVGALSWGAKKAGLMDPDTDPYYFTEKVNDLADTIAFGEEGKQKIRNSMSRAVAEGVIMAPLSGAKSLGTLGSAALAGGTAGGVAHWANEADLPWWAQLGLPLAAGAAVGKIPYAEGRTLARALADKRLGRAIEGLSERDLALGAAGHAEGRSMGMQLLPSQALDTENVQGLQQLQGALLASRASKADALRSRVGQQPEWARDQLAGLRHSGGQTPRPDSLLAEAVKEAAERYTMGAKRALTASTADDYAAGRAPLVPRFGPANLPRLTAYLDDAIASFRGDPAIQAQLTRAKTQLSAELAKGDVTPEVLVQLVTNLKRDLPADRALEVTAQTRVAGAVSQVLDRIRDQAEMAVPRLRQARETQAATRPALPGQFDDFVRTAKASGKPSVALDNAAKSPDIVGHLAETEPLVAQELLSREVRQAIEQGLRRGKNTDVVPRSGPIEAKIALTQGPAAEVLQQNLPALFRDAGSPEAARAAADGFNQVLRVVARASKEPGSAFLRTPSKMEALFRLIGGSHAQVMSESGRTAGGFLQNLSDNATIKMLNRPDVMEQLIRISRLPPSKVTEAVILSTLPQLFQESQ